MLRRIVVVEPRRLLQESLVRLLSAEASDAEITTADNVGDLADTLGDSETVILLNAVDNDGYSDVLAGIVEKAPDTPCVLLVTRPTPVLVASILREGARGVIAASTAHKSLAPILTMVVHGQSYVPPEILNDMTALVAREDRNTAGIGHISLDSLNERQHALLKMIGSGHSNREISEALHMRENTVKAHVAQLMRTFRVRNRTELALITCQISSPFACPLARGIVERLELLSD